MSVTSVTLPSAFAVGTYSPAFNPAQTGTANQVSGEQQVVAANAGSDPLFLVPAYAPFFATTVSLSYTPAGGGSAQPLTAGIDYFFALPFISASRALAVPVFGGLVLANNQLAGTITLAYTTLGGSWTNTVAFNLGLEGLIGVDLYGTAFEQVANFSSVFPQVIGPWDKTDPTGLPDVMDSIKTLVADIGNAVGAGQTITSQGIVHLFDTNNPHHDTASTIGLAQVENYPPATDVQAADNTNNTCYVSPAQLRISFAAGLPHAGDNALGVFKLNDASQGSDPTDNTKVLTAASFESLVQQPGTGIYTAFNRSQREASFSPYPLTFPVTWKGTSYPNMASLLQGIANFTGVTPLEFSVNQGKIWFPAGTTVPSLVTPS